MTVLRTNSKSASTLGINSNSFDSSPRKRGSLSGRATFGRSVTQFGLATGGSTKDFVVSGGQVWRQHVFTSNSTFNVLVTAPLYRVTMIAGGGNSGYADCPTAGGTAGGGGGAWRIVEARMQTGPKTVTVGGVGGNTSVETIGTVGGGGNGCRQFYGYDRTDGKPGTWGGDSNGKNGCPCNDSGYSGCHASGLAHLSGYRTLLDGTTVGWGQSGGHVYGNPCGFNPGSAGGVAIEYRVG